MKEHDVITTGREVDVRNQNALFTFLGAQKRRSIKSSISHLVYSAGITGLDWSMSIEPEEMIHIYEVNVVGLVNVLQMLPMVKRVVVVGSDAAWRPMRTSLAYCASKAALHMAVQVVARERASDEFAINVVAPGMTEPTAMQKYIDNVVPEIRKWDPNEARHYEESQIPMRRRATTKEVASVVIGTLLAPTNYLNGAIIPVNGGR
jgi:NAD(P)-dependent dehydrogenase (short-subunit alcohol dehydrogenase family)